jgi:autotransporter translocation and assembly factor TamB
MKRYIIPGSILVFLVAVVIAVKTIDFGRLTVSFIEKSAHVDITYEKMQGSVLRGFRFYNYKVKLSDTDSIVGDFAEIDYRFSSFRFGLPNLFEINLLEPRVNIRAKTPSTAATARAAFKLPILNLGLRINLKNGEFTYETKRVYLIRKISGLVFLDFIGSRLDISTMNLSAMSPDWPVPVTTANTSLIISNRALTVKSFYARGEGFILDGSGEYSFLNSGWSLKLRRADLNLKTLGLFRGRIEGKGSVVYARGRFQPRIQGSGTGLDPVDQFKFETNIFGDTVVVNIFDGVAYGGEFSAEAKFVDFRDPILLANFKKIDLAVPLKLKTPIRSDGYLRYGGRKFAMFANLSVENGPALDSIYAFGLADPHRLDLDSLFIRAGDKVLNMQGSVLPQCSLDVVFNKFDLNKFAPYLPLQGRLSGPGKLRGDLKRLGELVIDADLALPEISAGNFQSRNFTISTRRFRYGDGVEFLKVRAEALSYKKYSLDSLFCRIQDGRFVLQAGRRSDSLRVSGTINKEWMGVIEHFVLAFNNVVSENSQPVDFDLPNRKIGAFALQFMGGIFKGTLQPLQLELLGVQLSAIGRFLRYRDTLQGKIDAHFDGRAVGLEARQVVFMGLHNGRISMAGTYDGRRIALDSLSVRDDNGQRLDLDGYVSPQESDVNLRVKDFGVWPLIFLKGIMDQPTGIINGAVRFTGNFENFKMTGEGRTTNFAFGLKIIAARFDSCQGLAKFTGDRIVFQDIRGKVYSAGYGKSGPGAEINGGGVVKLEPRFKVKNLNFDFNFKDAPIQYPPFAYGRGTGNFNLNMKNEITYYSGNITVKEGVVPIDFGTKFPEGESNKKADDKWRMNLRISADRNVWFRNNEADIEFGGDLYIIKEQGPLYFAGTFETKRGDFYWFSHTLKITEGRITFVPEEVIDPQLDFTAELNTHERSRKTENKDIVITLRATGTLSEPIFEFFSDPPDYSEQDILTYLNLNITWDEMESIKQGRYVGEVLPKSLLAWLESDMSRRIRNYTGMDMIRIEAPFFESGQKTKLTVGKYISRNLFITYTYDFTTYSNQFNVEYFINDKNEILVKREDTGEYTMEYQYRIRF